MNFPLASPSRPPRQSPWPTRLWWLTALLGPLVSAPAARGADEVQFGRDILPILSAHCFACHGPDAQARKADLRLDLAEAALAKRDSGHAFVAGSLDDSEAWQRITSTDETLVMPPPSTEARSVAIPPSSSGSRTRRCNDSASALRRTSTTEIP